jgi:phospholipase C
VIHYSGGEESQKFQVSSALDGKWIGPSGSLVASRSQAADIKASFLGNGQGYQLQYADGSAVGSEQSYKIWSVTYR